jgi:uncharacterized protein YdeI (YjbR/CyaY-like superfamily)
VTQTDRWSKQQALTTRKFLKAGEILSVSSRTDFRNWLAQHHRKKRQIWLVLYKKSSGKQAVTPVDALEEAICYGWIDTQVRSIDAKRYAMRFVPRRKESPWSDYNKAIALKMLNHGKMTKSGMSVLPNEMRKIRSSGSRESS